LNTSITPQSFVRFVHQIREPFVEIPPSEIMQAARDFQ
jgi:hypothetical protein